MCLCWLLFTLLNAMFDWTLLLLNSRHLHAKCIIGKMPIRDWPYLIPSTDGKIYDENNCNTKTNNLLEGESQNFFLSGWLELFNCHIIVFPHWSTKHYHWSTKHYQSIKHLDQFIKFQNDFPAPASYTTFNYRNIIKLKTWSVFKAA